MKRLIVCLFLGLAACATAPETGADAAITLEETPCFGFCPVYTMTLHSDGAYVLEGGRNTRQTGLHRGQLSPAAYDRAAAALEEAGFDARDPDITMGNPAACRNPHTDAQTANITWSKRAGKKRVTYYQGCNAPKMRKALEELRAAFDYDTLIAKPRE